MKTGRIVLCFFLIVSGFVFSSACMAEDEPLNEAANKSIEITHIWDLRIFSGSTTGRAKSDSEARRDIWTEFILKGSAKKLIDMPISLSVSSDADEVKNAVPISPKFQKFLIQTKNGAIYSVYLRQADKKVFLRRLEETKLEDDDGEQIKFWQTVPGLKTWFGDGTDFFLKLKKKVSEEGVRESAGINRLGIENE